MSLLKAFLNKEQHQTNIYLLICCLCMSVFLSAASAKSGSKGIGINNPQPNLLANPHANPHTNLSVNPAGIIAGSGGQRVSLPSAKDNPGAVNIGAVTGSYGNLALSTGDALIVGQPQSNVMIKICFSPEVAPALKNLNNTKMGHPQSGHIRLAAGDVFSKALTNLNLLSSSLEVPDPIGAKGANPGHGGNHPKKGYGNPGGGNGRGNWGKGNKGNGFGNTWTGNQGRGVGEGMAGRDAADEPEPTEPPEQPELPEAPGGNEQPYIEPAPLHRPTGYTIEEEKLEKGGCPALMRWLAAELGIEEKSLQISVADAFIYSTDIQACETAAALLERAETLNDTNGTGIAALIRIVNELIPQDAPVSEEQLAMIAEVLSAHRGDDTHYAAAGQWLDALLEYVLILKNEMDWSADDAATFVIDKYCTSKKEGDNATLILYITARLLEV